MDVMAGLQRLGFSEYEARAYTALLAHPGVTGYEVARLSGIPRAKVYEVLGTLIAKGHVFAGRQGDRTIHHPLSHDVLTARYLESAEQLRRDLTPALGELAVADGPPAVVTIRSYRHVMDRARDLIRTARGRLFVSGWPEELTALERDLSAAEARGVAVYVLIYGDAVIPVRHLFRHHTVSAPGRGKDFPSSWLIVTADQVEALIAEPARDQEAVGLCTSSRALAAVAAEQIKHDIILVELTRAIAQHGSALADDLGRSLAHLQGMWFDPPARTDDQEGAK